MFKEDLEGVKWVFHLAADPRVVMSVGDPLATHENNATVTLKLLLKARDAGVEKFIFSSSCAVYGDPTIFPTPESEHTRPISPYGIQKLVSENYCEAFTRLYNFPTVSLRYFNVYGEGQNPDSPYSGVLTIFENSETLTIFGDGKQTRDFVCVKDIVSANITAAERGTGVYNVGTGVDNSINQVAAAFKKPIQYKEGRPGDPLRAVADISRLRGIGWEPTVIGYERS